jgi:hypothetical protein
LKDASAIKNTIPATTQPNRSKPDPSEATTLIKRRSLVKVERNSDLWFNTPSLEDVSAMKNIIFNAAQQHMPKTFHSPIAHVKKAWNAPSKLSVAKKGFNIKPKLLFSRRRKGSSVDGSSVDDATLSSSNGQSESSSVSSGYNLVVTEVSAREFPVPSVGFNQKRGLEPEKEELEVESIPTISAAKQTPRPVQSKKEVPIKHLTIPTFLINQKQGPESPKEEWGTGSVPIVAAARRTVGPDKLEKAYVHHSFEKRVSRTVYNDREVEGYVSRLVPNRISSSKSSSQGLGLVDNSRCDKEIESVRPRDRPWAVTATPLVADTSATQNDIYNRKQLQSLGDKPIESIPKTRDERQFFKEKQLYPSDAPEGAMRKKAEAKNSYASNTVETRIEERVSTRTGEVELNSTQHSKCHMQLMDCDASIRTHDGYSIGDLRKTCRENFSGCTDLSYPTVISLSSKAQRSVDRSLVDSPKSKQCDEYENNHAVLLRRECIDEPVSSCQPHSRVSWNTANQKRQLRQSRGAKLLQAHETSVHIPNYTQHVPKAHKLERLRMIRTVGMASRDSVTFSTKESLTTTNMSRLNRNRSKILSEHVYEQHNLRSRSSVRAEIR